MGTIVTRRHGGIILLLIAALAVRVAFVGWASGFREHPDMLRYKDWARITYLYGPSETYRPDRLTFGTYPNNQPPGTLYALTPAYWLWLQAGRMLSYAGIAPGSNPWVNVVLLQICMKIPAILSDLFIGLLVYAIVLRRNKNGRQALAASSVFLFNPAVLYNSAFWGQTDAVNNVFAVLALYFLIQGRFVAGFGSLVVSLLVKSSLVFSVPFVAAISLWKNKRWKRMLIGMGITAAVLITLFVMPVSRNVLEWYGRYLRSSATGEMTNVTAFAFNAWWVIFRPQLLMGPSADPTKVVDISLAGSPLTQTTYGPVTLGMIAVAVSLLVQLFVYIRFLNRKAILSETDILKGFAALALIAYLTLPQMHERYLYPALAPLAILTGFGVPVLTEYTVLSFLNLLNLIAVWHPMPLPVWAFDQMRNVWWQWSVAVLTVLTGGMTVIKLLSRRTP